MSLPSVSCSKAEITQPLNMATHQHCSPGNPLCDAIQMHYYNMPYIIYSCAYRFGKPLQFPHKYDLKQLKGDNEKPIKHMSQKLYSWSFVWTICICSVTKVGETLGLAVNLKLKLESGVFSQWDDNQVLSGPDLFKEQESIKVRASQHMLLEMYHGTNKEDF